MVNDASSIFPEGEPSRIALPGLPVPKKKRVVNDYDLEALVKKFVDKDTSYIEDDKKKRAPKKLKLAKKKPPKPEIMSSRDSYPLRVVKLHEG